MPVPYYTQLKHTQRERERECVFLVIKLVLYCTLSVFNGVLSSMFMAGYKGKLNLENIARCVCAHDHVCVHVRVYACGSAFVCVYMRVRMCMCVCV